MRQADQLLISAVDRANKSALNFKTSWSPPNPLRGRGSAYVVHISCLFDPYRKSSPSNPMLFVVSLNMYAHLVAMFILDYSIVYWGFCMLTLFRVMFFLHSVIFKSVCCYQWRLVPKPYCTGELMCGKEQV